MGGPAGKGGGDLRGAGGGLEEKTKGGGEGEGGGEKEWGGRGFWLGWGDLQVKRSARKMVQWGMRWNGGDGCDWVSKPVVW